MTALRDELLPAFKSLIAERGGGSKFSDWQLEIAATVVTMTADMRRATTPRERAQSADAINRMLELLPPVVPIVSRPESALNSDKLQGMSAKQLAKLYGQVIAGDSPYELTSDEAADFDSAIDAAILDLEAAEFNDPDESTPEPSPERCGPIGPDRSQPLEEAVRANPHDALSSSHGIGPAPPTTCSSPAERDHRLKVFSFLHLKDDDPRRQL